MEAHERNGVPNKLVRRAIISDLGNYFGDVRVVNEAYQFLTSLGVVNRSQAYPGSGMILTERNLRLMDGEQRKVEAEIVYEPAGKTEDAFAFHVETNLSQTDTQVDRYGNQILVTHTYADDAPEHAGETIRQGGSVSVMVPQTTIRAEGFLYCYYPILITSKWTGAINSVPWIGGAAYTWLCTEVSAKPESFETDIAPIWRFTFEFQHNWFGWIPQAIFIDPETGKAPADIVAGTGTALVDWYSSADFNSLFPV